MPASTSDEAVGGGHDLHQVGVRRHEADVADRSSQRREQFRRVVGMRPDGEVQTRQRRDGGDDGRQQRTEIGQSGDEHDHALIVARAEVAPQRSAIELFERREAGEFLIVLFRMAGHHDAGGRQMADLVEMRGGLLIEDQGPIRRGEATFGAQRRDLVRFVVIEHVVTGHQLVLDAD
jgi:hypothetical protein